MSIQVLHKKVADSTGNNLVLAGDWNDSHEISGGTPGNVLGFDSEGNAVEIDPSLLSGPQGIPGQPQEGVYNIFTYLTGAEQASVESGDELMNVTDAFTQASEDIQAAGGGTLFLPPGTYIVGKQTFGGDFLDGTPGAAYGPQKIITVNNVKSVRIVGYGAILKTDPTMRYGSFDPVTGERYDPVLPFYDAAYYGYPYRGVINLEDNDEVVIEGVELDGNNENIILGGFWGDSQWQLEGHGLALARNKRVTIKDVNSHNQPCDGMVISNTGMDLDDEPHFINVENYKARYNTRQGISLVGGKNIIFNNVDLSFTGQAFNGAEQLLTYPAAGIDIEAESSVIRDVIFINPYMMCNVASGINASSGNSGRVRVFGGFIDGLLVSRWNYCFYNTTFLGQTQIGVPTTNQYLGDIPTVREEGDVFENCLFTYDETFSETGVLEHPAQSTWQEANWCRFSNCVIDTGSQALPNGNTPYTEMSPIFENCTFRSTSTDAVNRYGIYKGDNRIDYNGTVNLSLGTDSFIQYGQLLLNGAEQSMPEEPAQKNGAFIQAGDPTEIRITGADPAGFKITKIGGGAGYNAEAISSDSVTGSFKLRMKRVNGTFLGGVVISPNATESYTDIIGIYQDGGIVQAYSYGGNSGASVAQSNYTFVTYDQPSDTFRFYTSSSGNFDMSDAVEFGTPVVAPGLGSTWYFDVSITTEGGELDVIFDETQDSVPPIANPVNTLLNVNVGGVYRVDGVKVVGNQGAAVANAVDAVAAPTQAEFNALVAQFNALLDEIRTHGLIAT